MALLTNDITQARSAYAGLELLNNATQERVVTLQATVDSLTSLQSKLFETAHLQNQLTLSQISTNAQLTTQQVSTILPDVTLDNFIAALGLSVALAEATMPDRAIGSVSASVQSYLTLTPGPNGAMVPGLRLYQPELGEPSALATTSFDISKTVAPAGTATPRALYAVLQAKQAAFANTFWTKFSSGNPPVQPAASIVSEIAKIFAAIGSWSFPYLLQEAQTISQLETTLAALIGNAAPQGAVGAYTASAQALSTLVLTISARSVYVAGDLYAVSAALDATTGLALALIP